MGSCVGPAGDEDAAAGEWQLGGLTPTPAPPRKGDDDGAERRQQLSIASQQLRHLGQTAGAGLAALGHLADVGTDEMHAVRLEQGDVASGRRIEPHARVHGGGDEHRLVGGHQHAGGEVVGMAAGHLGQQVGGGRRHDDQRGLARQPDVADLALVVEIEQLGEHAIAA